MNAQLVLENVGIRFPERTLFEGINWTLYEGMRVALAGRNGCGKSTLLKILAGDLEPHEGSRNIAGRRNLRIGYLDQSQLESAVMEARQLKDQSASPIGHLKSLLDFDPEENTESQLEWQIKKTLSGLGFKDDQMNSPMNHLSGGWLLRMFIAFALLNQPDVLLLDEPTNHLDLNSIQWLEDFLAEEYQGSLVLVTHDVDLQKRVTDSLAIVHGAHFYYRSHQRDYLSFRDSLTEEERVVERSIEGVKKKQKELQNFVDRYRAKARMASRAQSKVKQIEKFDEELQELYEKRERIKGFDFKLHLNFQMEKQGSKFPMVTEGVSFRYDKEGPWILKDISFDIKRGQKIAIIGDNGAGKTTLLNVLAQRLDPEAGTVTVGQGVEMGYFGQHQLEELFLDQNVLDNLRAKAVGISTEQLRSWLGAFGFCGNYEISKPAKVLSGGEKARLALLRILARPINVCLLDEPTNHLDVETKELLKNSFLGYEGTLIFVSHDREFVRALADRVIYISNDHHLTDHIGNLESFFEKYPDKLRHLDGSGKLNAKKSIEAESSSEAKLSYEERKKRRNQIRSLKNKISRLEADIDNLGKKKEEVQTATEKDSFYDPNNEELRSQTFNHLAEIDRTIGAKMTEWEKLSTELEQLNE